MTILEQNIGKELDSLISDKKQELLHFLDALLTQENRKPNRKGMGIFANLGLSFSEEDLKEARHEMSGKLPQSKGKELSAQKLYSEWRKLPVAEQQEFLNLVKDAVGDNVVKKPFRDPRGILADIAVDVSPEDFAEARRDMLFNFPKDIEL